MRMCGLKRLLRETGGSTIVEFALLAPILLTILLGSVTAFDMFRNAQNVEKATFTIGDMLSREYVLTASKLTGMLDLLQNMVPTARDGGLRISSVAKDKGVLVLRWSRSLGSNVPDTPLPSDVLPDIAEGDSVLITESFVPHEAMVAGFGFGNITFQGKAAHRPRFVIAIPEP